MKTSELRALGVDELRAKTSELRESLFHLRMQKVTGQLKDTSALKKVKILLVGVWSRKYIFT